MHSNLIGIIATSELVPLCKFYTNLVLTSIEIEFKTACIREMLGTATASKSISSPNYGRTRNCSFIYKLRRVSTLIRHLVSC